MMSHNVVMAICFTCLFPFAVTQQPTEGVRVIDEEDQGGRCESLSPFTRCQSIGYSMTYFPNFRGHENQAEAETEISDYYDLVDSACSEFILQFLCVYYFPICSTPSSGISRLRPCKSLCEAARRNCSEVLSAYSNFTWPTFLDCSLDTFTCDPPFCVEPPNLPTPPSCLVTETTTADMVQTSAPEATPNLMVSLLIFVE
jgi:frizzled protein 1/7/fibroblast growth factor receptor 3